MKKSILCSLIFILLSARAYTEDRSDYVIELRANRLVREEMNSFNLSGKIYDKLFFEVDYAYKYFHRIGLSAVYKFEIESAKPYITTGLFVKREKFASSSVYKDYCLKLGVGLATNLTKNLFFNFEASGLNYISEKFSYQNASYKEKYAFGESLDYSISFGFGYRFHF